MGLIKKIIVRRKIKRFKKSFEKREKASEKLSIAKWRRKQAEKGNVFKSLFDKPKKKIIKVRRRIWVSEQHLEQLQQDM